MSAEGYELDRSTSLWFAFIGFSLLGATALYSCVPQIQADLSARALEIAGAEAAPTGWASIQIDGQRLILTGAPPDAARARTLIHRLAGIDGVIEVDDQLSMPAATGTGGRLVDSGFTSVEAQQEESAEIAADAMQVSGQGPAPGVGVGVSADGGVIAAGTSPTSSADEGSTAPAQVVPQVPVEASTALDSNESTPVPDPIIEAAEAGPGRPMLSEPLARCQRDIDALLTGSASFFPSASSDIAEEALPIVDQVAALLAQCNARAEIAGHTDNSGRTGPNQQLSQARADAIRAHLIVRGVPQTQLSAIGFGEERPIVSNRTPEGRRQNRRIEVRIVDGQVPNHTSTSTGNRS